MLFGNEKFDENSWKAFYSWSLIDWNPLAMSDNSSSQPKGRFMPDWLQSRIQKYNYASNDVNMYSSSPPSEFEFTLPPKPGMVKQQSSPDLCRYEASTVHPKVPTSLQVTPLTSPESSPNLQRRNREVMSDSECDLSTNKRKWMFSKLLCQNSPANTKGNLRKIYEDGDINSRSCTVLEKQNISSMDGQEVKCRKKRYTITKFEINAFAPTSM